MKITRQDLLFHGFTTVSKLKPLGPLDATTRVDIIIALPVQNAESHSALLRDIYDPASPHFRKFLSPVEYSDRFDPTEEDYQALLNFAKVNELTVVSEVSKKFIHVTAPAAVMNKVFNVTLQNYAHPTEDRWFFAPDTDLEISFEGPGLQISGLDNFHLPRRANSLDKLREQTSGSPRTSTGSGFGGLYTGPDFRAAYAPDVNLTGKGEVVGILEFAGYAESDIRAYEEANGIPTVPLQNVYLDGYTGANPNLESTADIEMVISMAPGLSKVNVYGAPYTATGVIKLLQEMASPTQGEPFPHQITTSYYFGYDQNVYDALARFAAQGQAIFVASGDWGSYINSPTQNGDFPPADHPLVTSVGGTELVTSGPRGAWVSETTASFSGGGVSPWASDPQFALPWWQAGVDFSACKGSTKIRNAPDVSIVADDIAVFVGGSWRSAVGTSLAAPLWAGFMALANEQAVEVGRQRVGLANPVLWEIGRGRSYSACFHDITHGNNFNAGNPNLYSAVAGYDLCTGWGTPKGQNLIDALIRIGQAEQNVDSSSWLAANADGRLDLVVRGSDGAIWHIWQTAVNNGWSNWVSHGSPAGVRLDGSPILARNGDGRLHMFVTSADGTLRWMGEYAPGSNDWSPWLSLGKPPSTNLTDSVIVAPNANGLLQVFAQGFDQALWQIGETEPNQAWTSWISRGKPDSGGIQGNLCAAPSLDGRLEVFAIGNDGELWHIWQTALNGGWSSWFSHGRPQGRTFAGSTIGPVLAAQADGRLQLFVPTLEGDMWRISQTAVNNGWSDWVSHGIPGSYSFSDPGAMAMNADGRLELYVPAQEGIWHIWQTTPNGEWSDWFEQVTDIPSGPGPVDGSLALAPSLDGRLELFMLGFDKAIWHIWQTRVNNGWTSPITHGKPPNIDFQPNR